MLNNIQDYFKEQYQFSLKNVSYNRLNTEHNKAALSVSDEIHTEINEDTLLIIYTRTVSFEPASAFELIITFDAVLGIRNEMIDVVSKVDWEKELIETNNPYMANILARISALISNITSSYGQPPIVTPPGFISK